MKVYVITEIEHYSDESPEVRLLFAVSSVTKAEECLQRLNESVSDYNKYHSDRISYDYEDLEIDDLSQMESIIESNKNGR